MNVRRSLAVTAVGFSVSISASFVGAMTFVPPLDLAELAIHSESVVLARARDSIPARRGELVYTHTGFEVLRVLSGEPQRGDVLDVQVPGGELDGLEWRIPGMPRFRRGDAYVLFLCRKTDEIWITSMFSYGLLREVTSDVGVRYLVRLSEARDMGAAPRLDGAEAESAADYRSVEFLDHLGEVLAGRERWNQAGVKASEAELLSAGMTPPFARLGEVHGDLPGDGGGAGIPDGCNYFGGGAPWRQRTLGTSGRLTVYANAPGDPSIRDGGYDLIQDGLDKWMGVSDTGCNMLFGGARQTNPSCGGQANFILLDDPCGDIADLNGCGGTLAFGGGAAGGSHTFDGIGWTTMQNWFVVMNNGVGCLGVRNYRVLVAHELGHGMGFGHANSSGALMWGSCCPDISNVDRTCVRFTYPSRVSGNERPQPDAGGDRTLTISGSRSTLRGSVLDDGLPAGGTLVTEWVQLSGPEGVEFADASSLVTMTTFPESGRYLIGLIAHDGDVLRMDQAWLDVEISSGPPAFVFQQGLDGYTGTVDTMLVEASPASNRSESPELFVDGDDPGGSGQITQVLIRFDDIFGEGTGQLPPGTAVRSARLEFSSTDPGTGAAAHRMRAAWSDTDSWSTLGGDGIQVGVDTLAEPDGVADALDGGIVSIDVTSGVVEWSESSCPYFGWALVPIGSNGWDFFSAEGDEPPRLIVETTSVVDDPLIVAGDEWRYFKGTEEPPAAWNQLGFVPGGGWLTGLTGIGYDDDDDVTTLDDMRGSYPSVFCRREFNIGSFVSALRLRIDYDDGFAAYINGVEVARSESLEAPGVPLRWDMLAASGHEAGEFEVYNLATETLVEGTNVLAIQVHNTSLNSSDLSLIPELHADHVLVAAGSDWRFLRGSEPLPADWSDPEFEDSGWEEGPTGIGYGDGDDLTELLDMRGSYGAIFCRRELDIESLEALGGVTMRVVYDDGVVIFVNGVEVERLNMPAGPVTASLLASGAGEPELATVAIPVELLQEGRNVIAVSVHNASLTSSDLSFDPVVFPTSHTGVAGCGEVFRRGDASDDGILDVGDVVTILLDLFAGADRIACEDAADFNDDGSVNATDPVVLLTFLFRGGARPPAPGAASCGVDPTEDDLADCPSGSCLD